MTINREGLHAIKETVEQIAEVIALVVGIDVTIIDHNGERLYVTGAFKEKVDPHISLDSVFKEVLRGEGAKGITDKTRSSTCQICSNRERCIELANLCAPITHDERIFGLISLVAFHEEQKLRLVENAIPYRLFLERMAHFLETKMKEEDTREQIFFQKIQLEGILNGVDQGVISLDKDHRLVFINEKGKDLLEITGETYKKQKIFDVFEDFKEENRTFIQQKGRKKTRYIGNYQPLKNEKALLGGILSFRPYQDVYEMSKELHKEEIFLGFESIVGKSMEIQRVIEFGKRVSQTNSTVLIQGESGTGKELFAKALHMKSKRAKKTFIPINCGSIPEGLLESELFGYEEGAFTGSRKKGKEGKLALAHEGTLFLDEVGDMPPALQVKLLRFLEDGLIEPLGATRGRFVDVRIIAATNRNLEQAMKAKEFREDLFYRLSVVPIQLPPLRKRREDIHLLAEVFLRRNYERYNKEEVTFSKDAKETLWEYEWPGNVRELENAVEFALSTSQNTVITKEDLPVRVRNHQSFPADEKLTIEPLEKMEEALIHKALRVTGSPKEAAEQLGIGQATIYRKMKKYGMSRGGES